MSHRNRKTSDPDNDTIIMDPISNQLPMNDPSDPSRSVPHESPDQRMQAALNLYRNIIDDHSWSIDIAALWQYRLAQVRKMIDASGFAGVVLYDPVNIRYATGTSTSPVFSLHFRDRYCFIGSHGPVVFFEKPHWRHLTEGSGLVGEVRDRISCRGATGGADIDGNIARWIGEIGDLVDSYGAGGRRLAMDHCEPALLRALESKGYAVCEAQEPMERIRAIKSAEELDCMRVSLAVTEYGMQKMQDALRPGVTENYLWSILGGNNIEYGGEWLECRLLTSGPRTNPWLQEASDRPVQAGEVVAFDTDIIGPFGYCADISRTFFCGPGTPTPRQRAMYALAREELAHNTELLQPGRTLREIAQRAFAVPAEYKANSYAFVAHGIGLCDEWPNCYQLEILEERGEGAIVIEAGMTLCVESYIGETGGPDGIKLEEQVLVTESGPVTLSHFPFETAMAG